MLDDLELSLMAFPQSWTAATHTLAVNLLVLPLGDPLGAVGSVPKFAGTTLKLTIRLITGEALRRAALAPRSLFLLQPFRRRARSPCWLGLQARLPTGTTVTTGKITAANAPPRA